MPNVDIGLPLYFMMWVEEVLDPRPHDRFHGSGYYLRLRWDRFGMKRGQVDVKVKHHPSYPCRPQKGDCVIVRISEEHRAEEFHEQREPNIKRMWVAHGIERILTPEEADTYEDLQDPEAKDRRETIRFMRERAAAAT